MRIGKAFAGVLIGAGLLTLGVEAGAHPAADDFLNVQKPGPRLTLMPFIGPGFRANYDHRHEVEKDMSEVRTQLIGTVAIPFSEVSANIDARFFLMTFGASIAFHNEWHMLQFEPDAQTGRDRAGQRRVEVVPQTTPPAPPVPQELTVDPNVGFTDLHRDARAMKDHNIDVKADRWLWYEGRWGFLWPAYNFMGVATIAARHDGRPDVTYDWEHGTVMNGGWHGRGEGYALFRERNTGFIGPAVRVFYLPRNRLQGDLITPSGLVLPDGSACQPGAVAGQISVGTHELEFHYGVLAGIRPNWVNSADLLLFRVYGAWGLNNQLFGTHIFRQPLQIWRHTWLTSVCERADENRDEKPPPPRRLGR